MVSQRFITDLLYSSDSGEGDNVRTIRITDGGSQPQFVRVDVQGVPADGVIDMGADITIMGKELFASFQKVFANNLELLPITL